MLACHPPCSSNSKQQLAFLRWYSAMLQTTFDRSRFAASRSEQSSVLRQPGFVPEALAEILYEVQPGFTAAFQSLQNRSTLGRYSACLVLANLTSRPVKQFQILIQCHRQAALVAGSPTGHFLAILRPRCPQRNWQLSTDNSHFRQQGRWHWQLVRRKNRLGV